MSIKISKIKDHFDIINSKAYYTDRDKFLYLFKNLQDGRYIHTIELVKNIRSKEQNNAMWGIPYMYFERALIETGNYQNPSKDQIHQFCMHHCLPEDYKERIKKEWEDEPAMIDMKTGEMFKKAFRLTTTKMKTTDAMNYYTNMQNFYAENLSSGADDQIPDPDPDYKNKKKKEK